MYFPIRQLCAAPSAPGTRRCGNMPGDVWREISSTVASALGASARVEYLYSGVPPMVNDQELLEEAAGYIDRLLGPGTCYELPRMTGSEDFSVLSQHCPVCFSGSEPVRRRKDILTGCTIPKVTFSEDMIPVMSAIYAEVAICWLEKPSELKI